MVLEVVLTAPLLVSGVLVSVRLLVAEDDRAVRTSLVRALTLEGYDVDAVRDGAEALQFLAGSPDGAPPDLLVLDVSMPAIDGLTVLSLIHI